MTSQIILIISIHKKRIESWEWSTLQKHGRLRIWWCGSKDWMYSDLRRIHFRYLHQLHIVRLGHHILCLVAYNASPKREKTIDILDHRHDLPSSFVFCPWVFWSVHRMVCSYWMVHPQVKMCGGSAQLRTVPPLVWTTSSFAKCISTALLCHNVWGHNQHCSYLCLIAGNGNVQVGRMLWIFHWKIWWCTIRVWYKFRCRIESDLTMVVGSLSKMAGCLSVQRNSWRTSATVYVISARWCGNLKEIWQAWEELWADSGMFCMSMIHTCLFSHPWNRQYYGSTNTSRSTTGWLSEGWAKLEVDKKCVDIGTVDGSEIPKQPHIGCKKARPQ